MAYEQIKSDGGTNREVKKGQRAFTPEVACMAEAKFNIVHTDDKQ